MQARIVRKLRNLRLIWQAEGRRRCRCRCLCFNRSSSLCLWLICRLNGGEKEREGEREGKESKRMLAPLITCFHWKTSISFAYTVQNTQQTYTIRRTLTKFFSRKHYLMGQNCEFLQKSFFFLCYDIFFPLSFPWKFVKFLEQININKYAVLHYKDIVGIERPMTHSCD